MQKLNQGPVIDGKSLQFPYCWQGYGVSEEEIS